MVFFLVALVAGFVLLLEALRIVTQLIAPFMPHLAEESWEKLGFAPFVSTAPWPKAGPALAASSTVTLPIQVNGKRRGEIVVERGLPDKDVEAAAMAKVPLAGTSWIPGL